MEKIRAIIVDDEPEARDIMASLLAGFGEVEVLSKDSGVAEAYRSVLKHDPDLVFLDIDMPGEDGFELLRMLTPTRHKPTIVFVTAYHQYAIDAIKHAAFDYLLKPVDIDDLAATIRRYKTDGKSTATLSRIENLLHSLQEEKVRLNSRTGTIYLNPSEIIYCQADGNYTDLILTAGRKQTVTMNIGRLGEELPPSRYARISRSVIINRQYLAEIRRREKRCILQVNDDIISLDIVPKYINQLSFE